MYWKFVTIDGVIKNQQTPVIQPEGNAQNTDYYCPVWALAAYFRPLILYRVGRISRMGDQQVERQQPIQDNTNTETIHTDINSANGIRTHDSTAWAGEATECLSQRGHCDRWTQRLHTANRYTHSVTNPIKYLRVSIVEMLLATMFTPWMAAMEVTCK
jgi:hypothetical protein